MKLKKLIKLMGSDAVVGLYTRGYFICNCRVDEVKGDILEAKIDSIWSGEYLPLTEKNLGKATKINITLKGE